ncbi:exp1-like protein [Physocladia obscura]|uniref:Exp1-like protein n=1 Tax=Physocladia obscura TaxID=109957 RepID=A0AAD5SY04_9FUNG|nr:exp1-like protein [Physocladia obscura]
MSPEKGGFIIQFFIDEFKLICDGCQRTYMTIQEKLSIAHRKLRAIKKISVSVVPPKRPPNVYALFYKVKLPKMINNPEFQSLGPIQKNAVAITSVAKLWVAVSKTKKNVFEVLAADAKVAQKEALDKYLKARTPNDLAVEKRVRSLKKIVHPNLYVCRVVADPRAPKKPTSKYALFVKNFEYTGSQSEKFKAAAVKWKTLSEESKKPYVLEGEKRKAAYFEAKIKYERATGIFQIRKSLEKDLNVTVKKPSTIKKVVVKKTSTKKLVAKKTVSKKPVAKKPIVKRPIKKTAPKAVTKTTAKNIVAKKPVKSEL